MPKLNVQQNNQNVIQAFKNALAIGNLKGIIASDGSHNFSTAGSNRNLLDNPWWGSGEVVNQRNTQSTPSNGSYTIDRWILTSGADANQWAIDANGITFTIASSSIWYTQRTANPSAWSGKTLTASVLLSDGTIKSGSAAFTYGTAVTFYNDSAINLSMNTSGQFVLAIRSTQTIRAVKLELGPVSTLANDAPPKESQVTDDCKWYFQRIQQEDGYTAPVGFGIVASSTTILRTLIPLSSPLRKAGTLTATATNIGQMRVQGNGSNLTPTAITGRGVLNGHAVVDITVNGTLASNQFYTLVFANSSATIDLSKDL